MSWGRHGWPRTNEGMRLYRERNGTYFLIEPDSNEGFGFSAIANIFDGPEPSLGSCMISIHYTYVASCKRVQWSELPPEWQAAFRPWLVNKPEDIRGFWLVGEQPDKALVRGCSGSGFTRTGETKAC